MGIASIVQIQLDREDMAWTCKMLVVLILAITMAETSSLPPVKFLKDFAIKYQRSSIVMNLPKDISRNRTSSFSVITVNVILTQQLSPHVGHFDQPGG